MKKLGLLILLLLTTDQAHAMSSKAKKILAPIFPYPAWQIDQPAGKFTKRNYYKLYSYTDILIEKSQQGHSGYDLRFSVFKKMLGVTVAYNITNNIEFKNKILDTGLIYRFFPKRHIRPYFAVTYKYINLDNIAKGHGGAVSLLYYDIYFNYQWGITVKSFAGAVNSKLYYDFSSFLFYKIYSSVTFKFGGAYERVFGINLYAIKLGFSLRL